GRFAPILRSSARGRESTDSEARATCVQCLRLRHRTSTARARRLRAAAYAKRTPRLAASARTAPPMASGPPGAAPDDRQLVVGFLEARGRIKDAVVVEQRIRVVQPRARIAVECD